MNLPATFVRGESGEDLIEYGLPAFVSVVVAAVIIADRLGSTVLNDAVTS